MFDPTTDAPALSLVIPVYNAADQLPGTLQEVDRFAAQFPDRLEVHITERRLQRGDMLLLCTDGVHGVVDDETLCELMSQKAGLEEIARSLIAMSFERGTRDNVTVVVVRYEG